MVTIGGRGTARAVVGPVEQAFLDVGLGDALDRVAQVLGDDLGRVGVERVGQGHHAALTHQHLDDVDGALGHAVGEFLDGDRLGQHDLARDLVLRFLLAVALEALGAAAERRDRTHALFLARGGAGDGETAAVALFAAAARARRRQHDLGGRGQNAGTADDAAGLVLLGGRARGGRDGRRGRGGCGGDAGFARQRGRGGRGGLAAAEATARLFLRLALEGGVLGAARFFLALARFGRLALGAFARLALAPDFGVAPPGGDGLPLRAPARRAARARAPRPAPR